MSSSSGVINSVYAMSTLMRPDLQIGATVGKGEYRVQAAEALVAAVRSSAASSPELVEMILQVRPAIRTLTCQHFGCRCGSLETIWWWRS